jgi:hypothetical protein
LCCVLPSNSERFHARLESISSTPPADSYLRRVGIVRMESNGTMSSHALLRLSASEIANCVVYLTDFESMVNYGCLSESEIHIRTSSTAIVGLPARLLLSLLPPAFVTSHDYFTVSCNSIRLGQPAPWLLHFISVTPFRLAIFTTYRAVQSDSVISRIQFNLLKPAPLPLQQPISLDQRATKSLPV